MGILDNIVLACSISPDIRAFQARRLRALVRHAYEYVPYYRRLFDRVGLKPKHVRGLEDLSRIPTTSRRDLQNLLPEDLVARGFDPARLGTHLTGGSSGAPLTIRRTIFEDRLLQAHRLRILFRLGMRITDRRVAIVLPSAPPEPVYMKMGILRHEEMNCLWPASRLLTQLRKARPDILRGYPGALAWLADHLDDSDRELICPRFITADSETLTPNMRDRIRAGFKARVFDFYDSHEFNVIAWECPVSGLYHVCDSSVLAEVLDGDRPAAFNEEGEFVGTALHSWAMPFIRMRLGDLVTRGPERCSCGRRGSILARVQGRLLDRFLLPGGESMHPCALLAPLYRSAPWLRQFQIVQQASGKIQVKLVPLGPSQPPEDLAAVSRALSEAIGGQLQVEAELVSRILPEANGKFRPFCTKVAEGS